jgi:hypothetical protein
MNMPLPNATGGGSKSSERPLGPLAWVYLALALAGGVLPWLANLAFLREHGSSFDVGLFVALANANPAAQSVTIWMVSEARRLRMRGLPWVLLSCVTIAFAFGAPLFLHLRERRLRELEHNPSPTL